MAKLTKQETKLHQQVMDLVHSDRPLKYDERHFVVENYNESANHMNGKAGAFFTPTEMCRDFYMACGCLGYNKSMLDICAGIGKLTFPFYENSDDKSIFTLVEINKDYIDVGKRVMPEANWIHSDCMDLTIYADNTYDLVVSNPPFGAIGSDSFNGCTYSKGRQNFELAVVELANCLYRRQTAFILPQMSVPFKFSGGQGYQHQITEKYESFKQQTGIDLAILSSVDCNYYLNKWNSVKPVVEFAEIRTEV